MAVENASRSMNGTWGSVWADGVEIAEISAFQLKVTKNFDTINMCGRMAEDRKLTGIKITGSMTLHKRMTHEERRSYLIRELLAGSPQYRDMKIPADERGRRDLLRALMNVRPPKPIGEKFLKVQDEYLAAERDMAGVIDCDSLPPIQADERLVLWQGDITMLKADAIVNAANSAMRGCFRPLHSCIDNIVHTKSGIQLRLYCDELMNQQGYEEPTGQAKITPAFRAYP